LSLSIICCESNILKLKNVFYNLNSTIFKNQLKEISLKINQKYFTFNNEGTGNDVWPFDKPQYLLINLAIGGGWGGQKGVDNKIFPQKYYIDYIKVFKEKK
jgi:hypothetical protein